MKTQVLLFAFLLATVCLVRAEDAVIELDNTNFDQIVLQNDLIMVEFYAPWCGHCKKLIPEYEKAAQELKGVIPIAKINADAETNKEFATKYGIRGFPTLKVFRKGNPVDYQGERSAQAIVSFLKKQNKPAITTLTTKQEVDTFVTEDKVVVVGVFDSNSGSAYDTFKNVAETLRNNFLFGAIVGNAEVAKEIGADSTPNVVLFKKFDEGKNVLGNNFDDLSNFIAKNSMPLVDEIGPENYKNYAESKLPLGYLFVDLKVEGQKDAYLEKIKEVATATKGKVNFVYIDFGKYAKHGEKLGLSGKVVPSFALEEIESGLHYVFPEQTEITSESITTFINQYLEGKLEPTIKSEEIPASNDGPVKVVVAKSFNDIVLDNTKDVFVEFYAPWCGHCKKLAPIFDELGTNFKSNPSVVIAKIDATANDVDPKLGIRGFPTLKFFPANNKTPVEYNGDRSLEDMTRFIKEHASIAIQESKDEL